MSRPAGSSSAPLARASRSRRSTRPGNLSSEPGAGPVGRAAATRETTVDLDPARAWPGLGPAAAAAVAGSWSAPVGGPAGVGAVITVFRPDGRAPARDELDLLTLYAGYAAGAVERDRCLIR